MSSRNRFRLAIIKIYISQYTNTNNKTSYRLKIDIKLSRNTFVNIIFLSLKTKHRQVRKMKKWSYEKTDRRKVGSTKTENKKNKGTNIIADTSFESNY